MALWRRKAPEPYSDDYSLGIGPDVASEFPPEPAARYEPGVLEPTPDPTIREQWRQLDHYRLTDDLTGNVWDRNRIRRSKRQEDIVYGDEGPASTVPDPDKQRDNSYLNVAPNPRTVTTPSNYRFTREMFYNRFERRLSGDHFSMATMARNYEIYGMQPAHPDKRNTFRVEPPSRDVFIQDRGAQDSYEPEYATVTAQNAGGLRARNRFRM